MEHGAVLKEKKTWKRNITGEMGAIGVFFMYGHFNQAWL